MTPFGILLIIIFFVASSWALVSVVRRLRRERVGARCWGVFTLLALLGGVVGFWCAFDCEYQLGAAFRVGGFPLPVVFFHLENGRWVDFPVPKFQGWATAFTNVISIMALVTLPLWLVFWQRHRNAHTPA